MNGILVDEDIKEQYPDIRAWAVTGRCMEPEIQDGQIILVSSMPELNPGRIVVIDVCCGMPRLGVIEKIVGEFIKMRDNRGGDWISLNSDVLGAVVGVV